MTVNRVRLKVKGSVGKSVNLTNTNTIGAIIGSTLMLPDGSVPTLAQLAAALHDANQNQPGNIGSPGGATVINWNTISNIPASIIGAHPILQPEEEEPILIPGPQGPRGPTGAQGPSGSGGGSAVILWPEDPDDQVFIPGAAGATGTTGGGTLTLTDGTHTVASVNHIVVTGGTVGGTSPNATLAISGGTGASYPLNFVQWLPWQCGNSNTASYTVTFPQTAAASGNTMFMLCALDGSQTFTQPTGWTVDINEPSTPYARFVLMHKTTAGETSATITYPSASTMAGLFFEVAGSHALDQYAVGSSASFSGPTLPSLPSITPSAGAAAFAAYAYVGSTSNGYEQGGRNPPMSAPWRADYVQAYGNPIAGRGLLFLQNEQATSATVLNPPFPLTTLWSFYGSSGLAYATFSIL